MTYQTIDELLSLEDVKKLGFPETTDFLLDTELIRCMFSQKYQYRVFLGELDKELRQRLITRFPALNRFFQFASRYDYEISMLYKEDDTFYFGYSYAEVVCWIIAYFCNKYPNQVSPCIQNIDEVLTITEREASTLELKKILKQITHILNEILPETKIELRDGVLDDRKMANFMYRNLESIIDAVREPLEVPMMKNINLDRLLSLLAMRAIVVIDQNESVRNEPVAKEKLKRAINYLERYFAIADYLAQKSGKEYTFSFFSEGREYHYFEIKKVYDDFLEKYPLFCDELKSNITTSELFGNFLPDARKKIRKEDFVKSFQVQWELIPKGVGEVKGLHEKTVVVDEQQSKLKQQKDKDLLDEKLEFYPETDYIYVLEGIGTFEGYNGYVYPNGLVVLEKFYRQIKKGIAPAHYESIVVMNIEDFFEMSQYSKLELIDMIRDNSNKSVRRLYHSVGWQDRVRSLIDTNKEEYKFSDIEEILKDIAQEKVKKYE